MQCKYPRWALNKIIQKQQHQQKDTASKRHITPSTKKRCHIVFHISKAPVKVSRPSVKKYGVQVHFKGGTTLKNLLVSPKDKDTITKKSSVIYWFKYDRIDCEDEYRGESSRTFEERYKEHLKTPSPTF